MLFLFGWIEFQHLIGNLTVDDWIVRRCLVSTEIFKCHLHFDPAYEKGAFINPKCYRSIYELTFDAETFMRTKPGIIRANCLRYACQTPTVHIIREK